MVAFFKLVNFLALSLLAVKASSSHSVPAERNIELKSSTRAAANATHVSALNDNPIEKRLLETQVYVCVTLTAGATGNFNYNGQTNVNLAQNTCVCVYAQVSVLGVSYAQVYLSDGTALGGSSSSALATSILNSQCNLLGLSLTCVLNTFGQGLAGLGLPLFADVNADTSAGVCIYASIPTLIGGPIIVNTGLNAAVAASLGVSNLRPGVGANAVAGLQGFSQCCAISCGSGKIACNGKCYSAAQYSCPSGVPTPKRRSLKRGADQCPAGKTACPVPGTRSWDCVDIDSDVETCGGCVNPLRPNARNSGVDCTAITGAGEVACVRGKCQIRSCAPRFALSADGNSCERLSSLRKNKDVLKKARRS